MSRIGRIHYVACIFNSAAKSYWPHTPFNSRQAAEAFIAEGAPGMWKVRALTARGAVLAIELMDAEMMKSAAEWRAYFLSMDEKVR